MKIGIFDPYLDDCGGGEKYMMTMAECLSDRFDIEVFWDNPDELENVAKRFSLNLDSVKCVPNIFSPSIPFFKRYAQSRKYHAIIYLSDGSIPLVACKLYIHVQQPLARFQNTLLKDKIKIGRITKFFCNSLYTKRFIGQKFNLKTMVVYPPIELHLENLPKENIILHVGRFRPHDAVTGATDFKKQGIMIQTFKKMVDHGLKGWKFVMAVSVTPEDMEAFANMKKDATSYPIEFLLNQTNTALWKMYSKAKIYWHASGFGEDLKQHPEFAEHFGISTVEAMGAGAVPVVINAGGQKEIVEDNKNGMVWDTLDELEEKTKKITQNESLWETLSHNAQKRAKEFAGDRFCREVAKLIGE